MAGIENRTAKSGPRYRVVWYEQGERQRVVFTDAAEAVRFKKSVEGAGDRWPPGWTKPTKATPPARPTKLTFGQWADTAITRRTRANERTKNDYRRDLRLHFADLLDKPLEDVDEGDVLDWLDAIQEEDDDGKTLAGKTIRNLHGFASSVFKDGMSQHPPVATWNPFGGRMSEIAAVRTEEMTFLTPQEFEVVLRHVREEYRPLISFLARTGLRYGEATALRVRDIELLAKRKTVTVTRAWKRTDTATWVIGEPKTPRSRRTLSLSKELVELLTPLWAGRKGDALLFPGKDGGRLPHIEVYKRGWAPAVARARVCDTHYAPQRNGRGLPPLMPDPCDCDGVLEKQPRIHDLRHSYVSWLITEGIRLEVISRRVGHSSIKITYDRYGHLDPSLDDAVNEAIDRALRFDTGILEPVEPVDRK